jgi:hypothetical protein
MLYLPSGLRIPDYKLKNAIPKIYIFSYSPPISFSIHSLLFHILHPFYLPSVFIQFFSPFLSLSLSLISLHPFHMWSIVSLSPHFLSFSLSFLSISSPSILCLFSLFSFPHLNLAIIFLSLVLSSPQVLRNFLLS